jgi:ParB family chromosome partitioning protein
MKRKALGKGLSALLPEAQEPPGGGLAEIDIKRIDPNPQQPRQRLEPSKLKELARSLQQEGVMQPLVVRKVGSRYQIVAGERRWRAARMAGIARVPAIIREVEDERLLELALIENIQREDLSPIEEAGAYRRLVTDLGFSQEQVADRVGKDRSTVANLLRLLRLPEPVRKAIAKQELSPGHARPLLALPDATAQVQLAREIVDEGLSVRAVERRVKAFSKPKKPSKRQSTASQTDPNTREAEDRLRLALGTKVHIARKGRGGHLEISFYSEEELGRLYEILLRGARSKTTRMGTH